ncbi:hypothetical protein CFC21_048928, partial [Triticum aestivum]
GVEADGGDPAEAGGAGLPARQRARAVPPLRRRRALPPPRVALLPAAGRQITVHAAELAGGQPRPRRGEQQDPTLGGDREFPGITPSVDTEAIQGRGSYDERVEFLRLIVDLVEASCYADNPEWSVDEQLAKDVQLVDSIAEKQAQIFSEECKLFPADVQIQSIYPLPDIAELELKLSEYTKKMSNLQQMVQELASKYDYNPNEDYAETELKLREHLQSFLETVKSFNMIYTKEIHPWTHMMEVPQLHGFGPAANRLLEAYNTLLKFLGNLRSLRDSYTAMAAGSLSNSSEPSSVTKIISDCESALTFLNNSLAILSTSVAREQGETL